jgi:plasmid stabilization system protein ParE
MLVLSPEIYKLDALRKNNPGNIRAFEKHSHRISYLIEDEAIYIIRVRYARKQPLNYK